jgi:predicted transcriptional regulator
MSATKAKKKTAARMARRTICLSSALDRRLATYAHAHQMPTSAAVAKAVEQWLDSNETDPWYSGLAAEIRSGVEAINRETAAVAEAGLRLTAECEE